MAIQNRRGDYADFDPQKMLAGEVAVVKENDPYGKQGQGYYYCYKTGKVKRLADYDENYEAIAKSWAVGPSGIGDMGTDSNNAKYWAGIAELTTTTPPYIGENGHWMVYDAARAEYIDSGVDASITVQIADITMIAPDQSPYVTNSGTDTDPIFHLFIPYGKGIASVRKTSTSGLVDTYTMTFSDGETFEYEITNGKSAYQSAVDGGYDRTEQEFYTELGTFKDLADDTAANAQLASTAATNASQSETNASAAAGSAAQHETTAATYAANAASAATRASQKATAAEQSATEAASSEANASQSETNANNSAQAAEISETNAAASETAAEGYADEAKTYYESMGGSVLYRGAIYFADLPNSPATGWQYYIKDAFTTDSRFEESGVSVAAGAYVAYTAGGKWSVTKTANDIYYDPDTLTIVFN